MNWTHRVTLKNWDNWYLIELSHPKVICDEDSQHDLIAVYDGWFEDIKSDRTFQIEELNFTLENE